eukprot:TRINITY_DN42640_c0_g1_i1.p1 TRINITY_DN42640_c0_g1~~TRINITY_DN42640_c0_g1_i1.p1  ORF type:complete len:285 (-),score=46.00 TRINITY_DN42640_c0_g1_i1:544-1398(-)
MMLARKLSGLSLRTYSWTEPQSVSLKSSSPVPASPIQPKNSRRDADPSLTDEFFQLYTAELDKEIEAFLRVTIPQKVAKFRELLRQPTISPQDMEMCEEFYDHYNTLTCFLHWLQAHKCPYGTGSTVYAAAQEQLQAFLLNQLAASERAFSQTVAWVSSCETESWQQSNSRWALAAVCAGCLAFVGRPQMSNPWHRLVLTFATVCAARLASSVQHQKAAKSREAAPDVTQVKTLATSGERRHLVLTLLRGYYGLLHEFNANKAVLSRGEHDNHARNERMSLLYQ